MILYCCEEHIKIHIKIYTTQIILHIKNTNNLVREIHKENNER